MQIPRLLPEMLLARSSNNRPFADTVAVAQRVVEHEYLVSAQVN